MESHRPFAAADFNKRTLAGLTKKGIAVVGIQSIPDMSSDMPWANSTRGYVISDNGTGKVVTFLEVIALAK